MQLIKRKIKSVEEPKRLVLKAVGYNTNDVLTISCAEVEEGETVDLIKNGEDIIININGKELEKLKNFLNKINTRSFNG